MGLYDELRCDYPLPDGWDPQGVWFQTKDTPDQYLSRYVLTCDGRLRQESSEAIIPYHGALTFYTSNVCGSSPKGIITEDDQSPWWAEYTALFDHGTLLTLEGQKTPDTRQPHITKEQFYARD